jgi:ABC-2 type transport system permease protein
MSRWLLNVFRLGRKEFASLAKDAVLVFFIIYSFSLSIYSIATSIKTDVANAPLAIVDSDRSVLSMRVRDGFLKPYFRRPELIDRAAADRLMDGSSYTFVLDIPPNFEADVLRGRAPQVQLNVDATAMTQAGIGTSYIQSIVQQEVDAYLQARGVAAQMPVTAISRAFFNPNLDGIRFHSVVAVVQNVTMLAILVVGAAVIREREHGTIEHLLVMPIRASEIAVAKIWANSLVILVASGLSLVFVVEQALKVPIAGSIPLFLAGTAVYLFAVSSLGVLLATFAGTMPQFALLAIPVFLILNMLSGAASPIEGMPEPLQVAIQLSPTMHYIKLAQSVLYRAAGFEAVWLHFASLAGLGALFLAAALARFRRMLAQAQ